MKKGLLTGVLLLGGVFLYGAMLTLVGTALRQPVEDTVFSVTPEHVIFPFAITGTPLIAEHMVCYDGPFTEEEGEPVSNRLALLLRNTSDREITQAQVILEKQEEQYRFEATCIPPQASILLVETGSAPWTAEDFDRCSADIQYSEEIVLTETQVQILDADMGAVAITNLTSEPLQQLQLYYKAYLSDAQIYVGGITFTKTVENLEPGQTLYLPLDHYASGYSRIVKVLANNQ